MDLSKKHIAAQLKEAANLLEVLSEEPFRARAYQNAARNIEAFEGDFSELFQEDRLTEIRGVGQGLASELASLKSEPVLPVLGTLYARVPAEVRGLFRVTGLGAKKIALLWQHGVDSLEELIAAVDDGRVAAIKGFGQKSAETFREGAAFVLASSTRLRLNTAEALLESLVELFKSSIPDAHLDTAGDYRRRLETVGTLELVIAGQKRNNVAAILAEVAEDVQVSDKDVTGFIEGHKVTIHICGEANFGAVLLHHTGSAAYVRGLQVRATRQGLELEPGGLYRAGELVPTDSEGALFRQLGLDWVPPEVREPELRDLPPRLVEFEDIKGLIHNHSTWSDAILPIRAMVKAARERGYHYLGMADHSKSSYYANGLSIERVQAQAREIETIRNELRLKGRKFSLLHGIEVDIMTDGSLDYPDEILAQLDYTVISVHQNFTLTKKDQTERIIRAVQNPYATILGHPSGRLLLKRPPYELDQLAVIEACAETGTVIEINANPHRLDMDWRYLIKAKEAGCRFSINPDAHNSDGFDDVRFGVMMARKAGLRKEDIINTEDTAEGFLAKLKTAN